VSDNFILVYGVHWCPDCRRSRKFLEDHQIPFTWIDIDEDEAGEAVVREKNSGNRSVPTLIFPDGSLLVEPSDPQLAAKLDLEQYT
jgi:thioredoxin reductase (NADPH)